MNFFVHDFCGFLCSCGERIGRELSCRVIHVVVGVIRKIKMARITLLGDVESIPGSLTLPNIYFIEASR